MSDKKPDELKITISSGGKSVTTDLETLKKFNRLLGDRLKRNRKERRR